MTASTNPVAKLEGKNKQGKFILKRFLNKFSF